MKEYYIIITDKCTNKVIERYYDWADDDFCLLTALNYELFYNHNVKVEIYNDKNKKILDIG